MAAIRTAFGAAFPLTVPIATGFLFLGGSYGLLMHAQGFGFWYPVGMAFFIFAGSMEFVTVNLLLSAFDPLAAFLLALMVNARHLFYGLSMLGRFRGLGWKKPYLIFAMCDETFAINSSAQIPPTVDHGWFMTFVSVLNRWYWIAGAALGWLAGGMLPFSTRGIEFVLTALFLTIFLDQWMGRKRQIERGGRSAGRGALRMPSAFRERARAAVGAMATAVAAAARKHLPAIIGVASSVACLLIFGSGRFMIPAMVVMLVLFLALRPLLDDRGGDGNGGDKETAR